MAVINLPGRFSDNFGEPIQSIFTLLRDISSITPDEEILLNYKHARFTHPFFSLALPLICGQYNRRGSVINIQTDFSHPATADHMSYILFPGGVDPLALPDQNFADYLERFKNKTYIPIINFP